MSVQAPGRNGQDASFVVLAGVVVVAGVAGFVLLAALGRSTSEYGLFVGPSIGALVAAATVNRRQGEVHDAVRRVEAQTNGVLDQRITERSEAAMRKVLTEAGLVGAQPTVALVAAVPGVAGPPVDLGAAGGGTPATPPAAPGPGSVTTR